MTDDISLDGIVMFVSSTSDIGVVDADARITFTQRGSRVRGRSRCEVLRRPGGRVRIVEHCAWETRPGSGTNVFDEAAG